METTNEELNRIIERAHGANAAARTVTPRTLAGWLEAVAASLEANVEELVAMGRDETHLADGRLHGELQRTTFQLRLFAQEVASGQTLDATIDHADESWGMGPRPDLRRVNVPLGVVGVFGASNFPFAFSVMGGDSTSALAAGCPVVHKIHEAHLALGLRTSEIVVEALSTAGAPSGLFATITGREAGQNLVDHPLIKAVGFTGSTQVGRLLAERARSRPEPIPFYGELGSINPVFVTRNAWNSRRAEILDSYVASFTLGVGQFCTKPGLLFVPALDEDSRQHLIDAVRASEAASMLTPDLAQAYLQGREHMAKRHGIEVLVAGGEGDAPAPSLFTVRAGAALRDPRILHEEMFGPASIIVEYGDEAELPPLARALDGQLTATVQAEPDDEISELLSVMESRAGRVIWNGWPTGVTVSYAQHHGGPYPATTAPGTTSVGTAAVRRFVRPVSYQDVPNDRLSPALQEANPWRIARRVDGVWQSATGGEPQ